MHEPQASATARFGAKKSLLTTSSAGILPASVKGRQDAGLADSNEPVPSWIVGVCGVAAVASALFSVLMFLNR